MNCIADACIIKKKGMGWIWGKTTPVVGASAPRQEVRHPTDLKKNETPDTNNIYKNIHFTISLPNLTEQAKAMRS